MTADSSVRLLRHATLVLQYGGLRYLVDPMLSTIESNPPIENTPNQQRNPRVSLPRFDPSEIDSLLVTHLHSDHFDEAAVETLPDDIPLFCQPEDESALESRGFTDLRPVEESVVVEDVTLTRTPARHGHGSLAEEMGPVSGFVFEAPTEPTVYLTGDSVWYEGVEDTIDAFEPDVVVVNAGAAQFEEGRPITMTDEDVAAVCAATDGTVVAVHMEAINHCLQSRDELKAALEGSACDGRLEVPTEGERVELDEA